MDSNNLISTCYIPTGLAILLILIRINFDEHFEEEEGGKFKNSSFSVKFFYYSGAEFIFQKFFPSKKGTFPTGYIWLVGLYFAIFAVCSQRYEYRLDQLEYRYNVFTTQVAADVPFNNQKLIKILDSEIPYEPDFWTMSSVIRSFLFPSLNRKFFTTFHEYRENPSLALDSINTLLLQNWKHSLQMTHLNDINFERNNLIGSLFNDATLIRVNFKNTILSDSNFDNAIIWGGNFENSHLENTSFRSSHLYSIKTSGSLKLDEMRILLKSDLKFNEQIMQLNKSIREISAQMIQLEINNLFDRSGRKDMSLTSRLKQYKSKQQSLIEKIRSAKKKQQKFYTNNPEYKLFFDWIANCFQEVNRLIPLVTEDQYNLFKRTNQNEPSILVLSPTTFRKARLNFSDFKSANLNSTSFESADLQSANFDSANLINTNFRKANLNNANFSNADLDSTVFDSANLESANVKNAKNLKFEQLITASSLYKLQNCPEEIINRINYFYCQDILTTHPNDWSDDFELYFERFKRALKKEGWDEVVELREDSDDKEEFMDWIGFY
ncbi:MAG: pentapeptide repeat-containing protein [Desulfobacter sp.]